MRILAATPYYFPDGGGLERYAHEILHRLAARGHDVYALAHGEADTERVMEGVNVERIGGPHKVSNTPLSLRYGKRLRALAQHADVVIGHGPVPGALEWAAIVSREARKPFVASYHAGRLAPTSPLLRGLLLPHRLALERPALARATAGIAPSRFVVDHALKPLRERTRIIPPGVDCRRFMPSARPREPALVLYVGPVSRAYRWKGFHVLFRALLQLRKQKIPVQLEIVGDGDECARYAAHAKRLGEEDAFMFHGRLPEPALVDAYQRATIAVLPSVTAAESFGMVLAEANACGAPVIGSRVGGIPDFVRHGVNGLLVRPGNPGALATAIRTLMADPKRAQEMGMRGRALVLAEHDWDEAARQTEEVLYWSVSARRANRSSKVARHAGGTPTG